MLFLRVRVWDARQGKDRVIIDAMFIQPSFKTTSFNFDVVDLFL